MSPLVLSVECSFSGREVLEPEHRFQHRQSVALVPGKMRSMQRNMMSIPSILRKDITSSSSVVCRDANGTHIPIIGEAATNDIVWTKFVAETLLPTKQGKFRLRGYRHTTDNGITYTEPSAIISGDVEGQENVVVRVHDACFTSEVLGSLKCDCREQLELAMDYIQDAPPGMIIYLQQEGRGIGLANKIAAYALQEKGLDTVDANRALGLPDDCREYTAVRHILDEMNIKSIKLMTNNPRKIEEMQSLGIQVTDRIPCVVKAQKFNQGYLKSKQQRMKHMFHPGETDALELDGSFCYWNHEGEPGPAGIPLQPAIAPGDAEDAWLSGKLPTNGDGSASASSTKASG